MSSFAPGFTARHHAPEHVLQRAFGDPVGFAPSKVETIGRRFAPEPIAPRHFTPADPEVNPTDGWDPFEAAAAPAPFIDPIAAAHAAGVEQGRAEAQAAHGREAVLLEQVTAALAEGAHFDRERMAAHLRQTVLHLVGRMVGEIGVAPDLLTQRVSAATDLLADKAESALLRLHPDDVALVEGRLPANIFAVGDPHLARGAFVIESASTIVEDGPDLWLEQLAQAIDRVPIPPAC